MSVKDLVKVFPQQVDYWPVVASALSELALNDLKVNPEALVGTFHYDSYRVPWGPFQVYIEVDKGVVTDVRISDDDI